MKRLLQVLRIPLSLTGFDVMSESVNGRHQSRRAFFYISILVIITCFTYSISINSNRITLSDRLFLLIADIAFLSMMIQSLIFWHYKEKFCLIIKEVEKLYDRREEIWLITDSETIFAEGLKASYKISK